LGGTVRIGDGSFEVGISPNTFAADVKIALRRLPSIDVDGALVLGAAEITTRYVAIDNLDLPTAALPVEVQITLEDRDADLAHAVVMVVTDSDTTSEQRTYVSHED